MLALDSRSSRNRRSSSTSRRLFQSEKRRERSYHFDDESHSLLQSTTRHGGLSRSQPSLANTTANAGTVDGYSSAREKLHSLLESYRQSQDVERERQDVPKSPYRVKFKPPVPRFRSGHVVPVSVGQMRDDGESSNKGIPSSTSRPTTPSYRSPTVGVGPHEWQNCPRRSPKRVRSRSLPSSPTPRAKFPKHARASTSPLHRQHERATTVPNQIPLDRLEAVHLDCGHPDLTPRQYRPQSAPDLRPPFVVPRPDPKLLSKRNFCGEVGVHVTAVRHFPPSPPNPPSQTPAQTLTSAGSASGRQSSPAPPTATIATVSGMPYWSRDTSDDELHIVTDSESDVDTNDSRDPSPAPARHTKSSNPTTPVKNKPQSSRGIPSLSSTSVARKHVSTSARSSTTVRSSSSRRRRHRYDHGRRELVSKYLVEWSGSEKRRDGEASPSRVIVDKIQRLRDECCACLVSAMKI